MGRIARSGWVAGTVVVVTAGLLVGCDDLGTAPTTYPSPTGPAGDAVGLGDVNEDGVLDVVTAGDDERFGVLLSDGSGGYAPATFAHEDYCRDTVPAATCDSYRVEGVEDTSAIGWTQLVISNRRTVGDTVTTELHSRASLGDHFTGSSPVASYPAPAVPEVHFGDINGDTSPDLVVVDVSTASPHPSVDVYPGNGLGAFGDPVTGSRFPNQRVTEVQVADIDGDPYTDLVLAGSCAFSGEIGEAHVRGCVQVHLANRAGGFWIATIHLPIDPPVDSIPDIAVLDIDEDGDLDIVGANATSAEDGGTTGAAPTISVFRGDGRGGFEWEESRPEPAADTTGAVTADFDRDGHADLLLATDPAGPAAGETILFGDGTGQFTDPHTLPRTSAQPGLVGDLDGDGRPDYVQNTTDGIRVFMNRWTTRPG